MIFLEQNIKDLYLLKLDPFEDERGIFKRTFCANELSNSNINFKICQGNLSQNFLKHTLRGFHFQKNSYKESKILTCISGSIYNVVIDLRPDSKSYKLKFIFELSARNNVSILVPGGCANAFLTLEDDTIIHYYMSDFFDQSTYTGFRYNDPAFKIEWPFEPKIISQKDLNLPFYDEVSY